MEYAIGTPEEIAEFLRLRAGPGTPVLAPSQVEDEDPLVAVAARIKDYNRNFADQQTLTEFTRRASELGAVVDLGRSESGRTLNYFRLERSTASKPTFCYVRPGTCRATFRLRADVAEGRRYVRLTEVQDNDEYKVYVVLRGHDAVEEALELVKIALEEAA